MNQQTTRTQQDRSIGVCSVLNDFEAATSSSEETKDAEQSDQSNTEMVDDVVDMAKTNAGVHVLSKLHKHQTQDRTIPWNYLK